MLSVLVLTLPERARAADCQFSLGFGTLATLIPTQVGSCVDSEAHNPANGDALQHTNRGLLVWRKADNWTAFTDGYRTWINGPYGLAARLNSERCTWEGGATNCDASPQTDAAAAAPVTSPADAAPGRVVLTSRLPQPATTPNSPKLGKIVVVVDGRGQEADLVAVPNAISLPAGPHTLAWALYGTEGCPIPGSQSTHPPYGDPLILRFPVEAGKTTQIDFPAASWDSVCTPPTIAISMAAGGGASAKPS